MGGLGVVMREGMIICGVNVEGFVGVRNGGDVGGIGGGGGGS